MRSASCITEVKAKSKRSKVESTGDFIVLRNALLILPFYFLAFTLTVSSQRVTVLTPDNAEPSKRVAAGLRERLEDRANVLDDDLSLAAYRSISPATPFNLTAAESKLVGSAIGCDFFILVRSATQRRSAFQRNEYYEAYVHLFVISSRTGRLVFWKNQKREAAKPDIATKQLDTSLDDLADEIVARTKIAQTDERNEPPVALIEEVPDVDSPLAKDLKTPIPYRRIKPDYTTEAALYGVAATIEILVDTDAHGAITRTEIVRWAGFGLEASVESAVRAMNWRPATRAGKPLAMRFLLRYNFKKQAKEE